MSRRKLKEWVSGKGFMRPWGRCQCCGLPYFDYRAKLTSTTGQVRYVCVDCARSLVADLG